MVLQDGRDVYLKVPVVQTGTWAVEGLPALVPGEKRKEQPDPETTTVPESKEVEAVVDGFFSAWLAGKTEAIARYSKADLQTANALEKLQGQYEGVTVEGLSESPLKVKAIVTVQDAYGQTLSFEYRLTMKKAEDNQWYITGME
ncbi:Conjugative transposon protein TcpC [Mycobacterium tuberculosis]|nr:Conjugative transposon protein TcpC [Mycobacterium tuberculosis]